MSTTEQLVQQMRDIAARLGDVRLMEICGTHTVSLFRTGVKSLIPPNVKMVSGPGCPVCVTAQGYIDAACELAASREVTVCTYGDMLRVPGHRGSLEEQRASGAQIVVVYSARDAVRYAAEHSDRQVVFLGVGFETTAPATAAAIVEADRRGLDNFHVLVSHKLVIPAMSALLSAGDVPIDGFMCPGHVSIIIGVESYRPIVEDYGKPCVVAGFEPDQMLRGIIRLLELIESGAPRLDNIYGVAVAHDGHPLARQWLSEVFEPGDTTWRAMGVIPESGLNLRGTYRRFDALRHFGLAMGPDYDPPGCRCGEVIQGKLEPPECLLFGRGCSPTRPIGPCMVSSEGTCAAWFKYQKPPAREMLHNLPPKGR